MSKSAYEARSEQTRALLGNRKPDLERQLDRLVALLEFAVTAIQNEMTMGEAAKGKSVALDVVKKLQQAVATAEAASRTKIALAKAEKTLAARLTPEQVLEAAQKKIMGLGYGERSQLLAELVEAHFADKGSWHKSVPAKGTTALRQALPALKSVMEALGATGTEDSPPDR